MRQAVGVKKSALSLVCLWAVVSCGPQGQLALPAQNIAENFRAEEGFRSRWNWSEPGSPAFLSLSSENEHEMVWSVSEKSMPLVRRSRLGSLQRAPRFFSQGPAGVREVRFSPSGKTILAHEFSPDGGRFQTVLFQEDSFTGAWRSRVLDLAGEAKTKTRKLDDGSRVLGLISPAMAPQILRLDEGRVIYEVDGKQQSLEL